MSISDHFIKMLEMMARALGVALFKLKDFKKDCDFKGGEEFIKKNLKDNLDIEFEDVIKLSQEDLVQFLLNHNFKNKQIELFAEIIYELSEIENEKSSRIDFLKKSKFLIIWVTNQDRTYSVERQKLLNNIDLQIKNINYNNDTK